MDACKVFTADIEFQTNLSAQILQFNECKLSDLISIRSGAFCRLHKRRRGRRKRKQY